MSRKNIRIVSVDVAKVDLPHRIAFLAYTLRAPVGDNHSACDVGITEPGKMCEELFEAARAKAGILAEAFSGTRPGTEEYRVQDYKPTRERLFPLFQRIIDLARNSPSEAQMLDIETDGVHLLRPDMSIEGRPLEERADILLKRAARHLEASDFEPARLYAQRALRIRPGDGQAKEILSRAAVPR